MVRGRANAGKPAAAVDCPGAGAGFVVTSETAHFHYKCTERYHPEDEGSIRWNDPELNVAWPISAPKLSAKDESAPFFAELKRQLGA